MGNITRRFLWSKTTRALVISPSSLIWLFALVNAVVFHGPLMKYVNANLTIHSALGVGVMLVLLGISFLLMWLVLGGAGLVSSRLLKPLLVLMAFCNAVALYAMQTYQVILDKSMMGNVINTDRGESMALFHPKLLVYLLVVAAASVVLFRYVRIEPQSRLKKFGHLVLAVLLSLALVYLNSSAWLWVDKHAKMIGGLLLPWSYTVNAARYLNDQKSASLQLLPLPELSWALADGLPVTVVLVIGESARAQNFSLLGYTRQTNPLLEKRDRMWVQTAQACSTYTTRSMECILSHDPSASRLTHEILPNYLHRSGQVQVLWRARNWGEPKLQLDHVLRGKQLAALCVAPDCKHPDQDESLLAGLQTEISQASHDKQLIVLHQAGSHGPAYNQKYPPEFSRFEPACDTVDLKKCGRQALVNAYDNSILYTDHFLDQLIGLLERQTQRRTVMIFVSDHGESLGEGGWYLHGAPDMLAPQEQLKIPFLVWTSPSFAQARASKSAALASGTGQSSGSPAALGQHQIFHSVLGALGGQSPIYRAELDVFQMSR
jgi:lipid A ethanolaminephosphotransferase